MRGIPRWLDRHTADIEACGQLATFRQCFELGADHVLEMGEEIYATWGFVRFFPLASALPDGSSPVKL